MKFKEKLEPILAHLVLGAIAIYLLTIHDAYVPDTESPSSWRAGALEAVSNYLHAPGLGTKLGKGGLIALVCYCIYKVYRAVRR